MHILTNLSTKLSESIALDNVSLLFEITIKAAELLNLSFTEMRQLRQQNQVYALEAIC